MCTPVNQAKYLATGKFGSRRAGNAAFLRSDYFPKRVAAVVLKRCGAAAGSSVLWSSPVAGLGPGAIASCLTAVEATWAHPRWHTDC